MEAHNERYDAGKETWFQAINQFSDMTAEEFQDTILDREGWLAKKKHQPAEPTARKLRRHPSKGGTVDWRKKGAVTPVKNQGQCGSCWTFSATGSIEGVHQLSTGKLVSFSEQQIVSCCHVNGASGCNGGIMDSAFQYIIKTGGLATEKSYPYKSGNGNSGRCNTKGKDEYKHVISDYKDVKSGSASELAYAIKKNPVSIAVDAGNGWQTYGGGIMSGNCGTQLDHGVLAVGYTDDYCPSHFLHSTFFAFLLNGGPDTHCSDISACFPGIVKNSWATTWGERGYIYLKRNDKKCRRDGECGLLQEPSYPTTSKELRKYDDIPDLA